MGMARTYSFVVTGAVLPGSKAASSRRYQAVGLIRREVTGCVGSDALLEAANGCVGQWPEDAVYRPFVIIQAM
jgi:hypothetical protein